SVLRKLLDPAFGGDGPIATVARRGYRFTASVNTLPDGPTEPLSALSAVSAAAAAASPALPPGERHTILVGEIENKTGDPIFDGTIRQALALVLAQSLHLDVLSDRRVHATLSVMQRQAEAVLGDVALEVCQRTNTRAAITGSIFVLGGEYVIGLYAMRGDTGDTLVSEQARAHGKGDVLR